MTERASAPVDAIEARAYTIPTESPESDGTLEWDATTIVVVRARAGRELGTGYSYTAAEAAALIERLLAPLAIGRPVRERAACWWDMQRAVRNVGARGLVASAIAAVDTALWDLDARLRDVPLAEMLGAVRERVPLYGSGGFTSYPASTLREQLAGWTDAGFAGVKMKVGRDPDHDVGRVREARAAIGDGVELMVDANGAYDARQALRLANEFAEVGVVWFEEPVPSDDREGLAFVRQHAPPGMAIAAGEYAYTLDDFRDLLVPRAVDVLQADMTRCGGYTGFLLAAALCAAHRVPLSTHTAPALHLPVACAAPTLLHVEHFFDHVRIESRLLEGAPQPESGALTVDRARPGHGLRFRHEAAEPFLVSRAA
ncbi:MAG: enolase C-terminal domain-like protein [Gemmatimonadales bacterium]